MKFECNLWEPGCKSCLSQHKCSLRWNSIFQNSLSQYFRVVSFVHTCMHRTVFSMYCICRNYWRVNPRTLSSFVWELCRVGFRTGIMDDGHGYEQRSWIRDSILFLTDPAEVFASSCSFWHMESVHWTTFLDLAHGRHVRGHGIWKWMSYPKPATSIQHKTLVFKFMKEDALQSSINTIIRSTVAIAFLWIWHGPCSYKHAKQACVQGASMQQ